MAQEFATEGLVLRRWLSGESDKVVSVLTPGRGKLHLRVRGTQKAKTRMGMLSEPLTQIRFRVIEGKNQRLLVQPQLVRSFIRVRGDLERLSGALALGELVDRWLAEEQPEPDAYTTVINALNALEGGASLQSVIGWTLWRLLTILGYCPDLSQCSVCAMPLDQNDTLWLSLSGDGQVRCARCGGKRNGWVALTNRQYQRLCQWLESELPPPSEAGAESEEEAEHLARLGIRYAESVLDDSVGWLDFWARLSALRENG